MDPREGHPADPEGAFPLILHPEGPPIFHPCTTAAPTWTSPLSIPEPPPAQMRTWDGVTLQVLNTEPQNPITYPCTPNITPRPPQSTKRGCPAVTPPTPTSLTQRVGGAVGGGLGGQDDELGGGLLGEGEDRLHGAGHGGGEGGWQVLVQRGVANAWGGGRGAKGGCQQWGEGGSPMLPCPPKWHRP